VRAIHIEYENEQVELYFSNYELMKRKTTHFKTIKKRIDSLKASGCFSEFLTLGLGKPHLLRGELSDCYGVSITGNVRLVIRPVCEEINPQTLKECEKIVVKGVCDYHGSKINWFIP
jgi:proteic killer suppression protein/toxin YoeB